MHVIDSLFIGGAERMLIDIANQTALDGHQVSIGITRSGNKLSNELRSEISLHMIDRSHCFDIPGMKRFSALVKKKKVDIFHAHGRSTFSFLAFLKTFGLICPPIVLHDHFGGIENDTSIPLWFRLWAKHWVSYYVGVYSKLGLWAKAAGIPPEKITVIKNALDPSRIQKAEPKNIRKTFGIESKSPIGIVVGGIRREKGIDILLNTFAKSSHQKSANIIFVGGARNTDYTRACRNQSTSLKLDDNVFFVGERQDVPSLIKSVDFALLPSRSESGPLVLIEYMIGGLPFVSTQVGAISRQIAQLKVPEFVNPNDPESFAKALDDLLNLSPEQRIKRGKAGQDIALRNFDIRQKISQWYAVYNQVLVKLKT